jgi:L-amino acid N-acyltransferase YncA
VHSRAASLGDAETIARIYNEGIEERIATFETRPRTAGEIREWFDDGHPIVVVEAGGAVISFANTSAYSPRECYSGVAEFSVYTAGESRGRGAGTLAMEALISAAEEAGIWKLTSRVFVENVPSRKLLLSGFPRGGGPREVRQARRSVARRGGRRATHPGQPVVPRVTMNAIFQR